MYHESWSYRRNRTGKKSSLERKTLDARIEALITF